MAVFASGDDLQGSRFNDAVLSGARFNGGDLTDVVMRGVDAQGIDIDDPWPLREGGVLLVNGIDVVPFVRAELLRRFPGRVGMRATGPGALRDARVAVEQAWAPHRNGCRRCRPGQPRYR